MGSGLHPFGFVLKLHRSPTPCSGLLTGKFTICSISFSYDLQLDLGITTTLGRSHYLGPYYLLITRDFMHWTPLLDSKGLVLSISLLKCSAIAACWNKSSDKPKITATIPKAQASPPTFSRYTKVPSHPYKCDIAQHESASGSSTGRPLSSIIDPSLGWDYRSSWVLTWRQ